MRFHLAQESLIISNPEESDRTVCMCVRVHQACLLLLIPPNGTSHSNKKLIQSADEFIVNIELLNKLTVHIFRFMNLDPVNQGIQQSLRQLVDIGVLFY